MSIFNKKEKIVDRSNLDPVRKEMIDRVFESGKQTGMANTEIIESLPFIEFSPAEIKYEGSIESFESIFPIYCFDTYLDNKIKFRLFEIL